MRDFIADNDEQSLILPRSDKRTISRAFTKIFPLIKRVDKEFFKGLYRVGESPDMRFFKGIYEPFIKVVLGIKDKDTAEVVDGKIRTLSLLDDMQLRIHHATRPERPGNDFIIGRILDKRQSLSEWKVRGISQEDYSKLGNNKWSTRGYYLFEIIYGNSADVKFRHVESKEGDPSPEEGYMKSSPENYSYIPLAMRTRNDDGYYHLVLLKKKVRNFPK